MIRIQPHRNVTRPAGQIVNPIPVEMLSHVEGPWRGPDAARLNDRHHALQRRARIDKAVDRVFRVIGGGMRSAKAIAYVAEDMGVNEGELRVAYGKAIEIAAESD